MKLALKSRLKLQRFQEYVLKSFVNMASDSEVLFLLNLTVDLYIILNVPSSSKLSRMQSIPLNQNKFHNNSGGTIHTGQHIKLVDTYEKFHVANKWMYIKIFHY